MGVYSKVIGDNKVVELALLLCFSSLSSFEKR